MELDKFSDLVFAIKLIKKLIMGLFGLTYLSLSTDISFVRLFGRTYKQLIYSQAVFGLFSQILQYSL